MSVAEQTPGGGGHRLLVALLAGGLSIAAAFAAFVPLEPSAESSASSGAAERAAAFRAQVARAEAELGPWQEWYRNLAAADAQDRVGSRFLHREGAERPMVDDGWQQVTSRQGQPIGPLATLTDFAAQLRGRGIDFLFVPVPPLSAIHPRHVAEGAPPGDTVPPHLDWRLRRFYAELEENGVEVLDLLPTLLDPPPLDLSILELDPAGTELPAADDPFSSHALLFRLQDRHWTALGSRAAAHALAQRIRRYPWFEEIRRSLGRAVIEDRWRLRTERGPIAARLVEQGRLPGDHPPETYLQRTTRIRGEEWSLDDPGSPILLLGDSFTHPHHGLTASLLVELGFRVDRITVPGGEASRHLDVLRLRGEEGLAGKKLVIWEATVAAFTPPGTWRPVRIVPE